MSMDSVTIKDHLDVSVPASVEVSMVSGSASVEASAMRTDSWEAATLRQLLLLGNQWRAILWGQWGLSGHVYIIGWVWNAGDASFA